MDLSDLRIFVTVVEQGGVTRAAERLHRVQSNITTRIRQLEHDLGVTLFVREGRRMVLTPTGRILLDYSKQLLALAQKAQTAVKDSEPGGLFRLGAMESTAAIRLPPLLVEMSKRFPAVEFELRTGNPVQLANAVLHGELDAALFAEPIDDVRLDQVPAFVEDVVIITGPDSPPIVEDRPLPPNLIVFERGCPHRRLLESCYQRRGETPQRTIELRSYHAMIGCVYAGMGAALLPQSVLKTFPAAAELHAYPLPGGDRQLTTLFVWRRELASPNVLAFANLLDT